MTIVSISRPRGETIPYTLPSWANPKDRFLYFDVTDLEDGRPSRRFIVHCCGYVGPNLLYVLKLPDGKAYTRYIDQTSPARYRLRWLHGEMRPETYPLDEVRIIGRVIEIWLTPTGETKWIFCDGSTQMEASDLNRLGTLLKQTAR